jgi:hypothetical protein
MISRWLLFSLFTIGTLAHAEVIGFSAFDGAAPASFIEGSFTFTRVAGVQACFDTTGNPGQQFSLGCGQAPAIGDRYDVTRTGGGLFKFTQFQTDDGGGVSDTMQFLGEVNSVVTQQLLNVSQSNGLWTTRTTGFSAPIDRLRMEISAVGTAYLRLDNLVLTPASAAVPEPSAALPVGIALLVAGYLRRR